MLLAAYDRSLSPDSLGDPVGDLGARGDMDVPEGRSRIAATGLTATRLAPAPASRAVSLPVPAALIDGSGSVLSASRRQPYLLVFLGFLIFGGRALT